MKKNLLLLITLFQISISPAQEVLLYKEVDSTSLFLEMYVPDSFDENKSHTAMIFFFGGGWVSGTRSQFEEQAKYFSKRGMVCFLVDYRVADLHKTSPFESVMDAKSAIRFIRANADRFHIDPDKIVASGGSAGGHLAASTALIEKYNEASDNMHVSCVPNALVLFNPVIDNGPGGYGFERISSEFKDFSPIHNIRNGAPPTLILLGTQDQLIPVETIDYYRIVMEKVGSECRVRLYPDQKHGFFNYKNFEYYKKTVLETDLFLQSLGYLGSEPNIEIDSQKLENN